MVEGKILIHMKLGQSAESYGLSRSESKLLRFETKITIVSDEIVSVGKDCIIVSKGKLPPLEEIKKAKVYKAENDSLKEKLAEVNDELENSLRKLKVLKEDKSELEFKLNKMLKIEEEFNELRLKCAKQEGELEASRRFTEKLKSQGFVNTSNEKLYPSIENEAEENLLEETEKKFEDILNDEFTLFGEEENLEKESVEKEMPPDRVLTVDETPVESQRPATPQSSENPFRRFSKEYKK
ncbi:MAG: hypothetical protein AMQ74_00820 [Candidatus Methanofastidiosum methylothiophilum]|uniref:Uncharacterized protein n=1 Tax=Candidatus Methanofastidiosum methylothiophilum TaxID=1705564 RepID=A0A150J4T4_9EURY|nr:MAG: hypothetical protein AMQ74_00820 [Candidatus Methanofastidiosum methylthiophilus]